MIKVRLARNSFRASLTVDWQAPDYADVQLTNTADRFDCLYVHVDLLEP